MLSDNQYFCIKFGITLKKYVKFSGIFTMVYYLTDFNLAISFEFLDVTISILFKSFLISDVSFTNKEVCLITVSNVFLLILHLT